MTIGGDMNISITKLSRVCLLNAPSYICVALFATAENKNDAVLAMWLVIGSLPAILFWLWALILVITETVQYTRMARAGSHKTIGLVLAGWLLTLPMIWLVVNFPTAF